MLLVSQHLFSILQKTLGYGHLSEGWSRTTVPFLIYPFYFCFYFYGYCQWPRHHLLVSFVEKCHFLILSVILKKHMMLLNYWSRTWEVMKTWWGIFAEILSVSLYFVLGSSSVGSALPRRRCCAYVTIGMICIFIAVGLTVSTTLFVSSFWYRDSWSRGWPLSRIASTSQMLGLQVYSPMPKDWTLLLQFFVQVYQL